MTVLVILNKTVPFLHSNPRPLTLKVVTEMINPVPADLGHGPHS